MSVHKGNRVSQKEEQPDLTSPYNFTQVVISLLLLAELRNRKQLSKGDVILIVFAVIAVISTVIATLIAVLAFLVK